MNKKNNIRNQTFQKVSGLDLLLCGISVTAIIPSFYTEESSVDNPVKETKEKDNTVTTRKSAPVKKSSFFNTDLNSKLAKENLLIGSRVYVANTDQLAIQDFGILFSGHKCVASFFDDSVLLGGHFLLGARTGKAYISSNPFDGSDASDVSQLTPEKAVKAIIDSLPSDSTELSTFQTDIKAKIADVKTAIKELNAASKDDKESKREDLDSKNCELIQAIADKAKGSGDTIKNKDLVAYLQLKDSKVEDTEIADGFVTALETAIELKQGIIAVDGSTIPTLASIDFSAAETIELAKIIFPETPVALDVITKDTVSADTAKEIFGFISKKAIAASSKSQAFDCLANNATVDDKFQLLDEIAKISRNGKTLNSIFTPGAPALPSFETVPTLNPQKDNQADIDQKISDNKAKQKAYDDDFTQANTPAMSKLQKDAPLVYKLMNANAGNDLSIINVEDEFNKINNSDLQSIRADYSNIAKGTSAFSYGDIENVIKMAEQCGTSFDTANYKTALDKVAEFKTKLSTNEIRDDLRPYIMQDLGMVFSTSGSTTQVKVPAAAIDNWKDPKSFVALTGDDLKQKVKDIFSGADPSSFIPAISSGLSTFLGSASTIKKSTDKVVFSKITKNNTLPCTIDVMAGPSVLTTISAFDNSFMINFEGGGTIRGLQESGNWSCLVGGAFTAFVGIGLLEDKLFIGPAGTVYFAGNGYKDGQVSLALQAMLSSSYFDKDKEEAAPQPASNERKTRSTRR